LSAREQDTVADGEPEAAQAPAGDAVIGATLAGLRRAAEEVEQVAAVAEAVQRGVLPERLPEIAGMVVSAR
jgi:hypothetical protein